MRLFLLSFLFFVCPIAFATNNITGTITYLPRIVLSSTAKATIQIQDITTNSLVASQSIANPGQVPIAFELSYDVSKMIPDHHYILFATIKDNDKLLFTTTEKYLISTNNQPNMVKMTLSQVSAKDEIQNNNQQNQLVGKEWKLNKINGQPITINSARQAPNIQLSADQRITGNDGCNQFFGSYELKGSTIHFSQMGSTLMACIDENNSDQFNKLLPEVTSYKIENNKLSVLNNEAKVVMEFISTN